MSELAPGSMSLEEENPSLESLAQPPEPAPAPEAPAQAPPGASAAPDPEPDGTIVNPNGEKLVPLGALAATRQQLRSEREAREREAAELAELRSKKAEFEAAAADFRRIEPLIQQLRQQPQPTPQATGPLSEQEAVEYARDLDLFKPDGTPDVARAQRLASRQAALAQQSAQQAVQPLYQTNAQQQSAMNFNAALAAKDKHGVQVDKAILEHVWRSMPPEMSANPKVAQVLYKVAYAETIQHGGYKPPQTPPPPVQFTESLGGNTPQPKELSAIDRAMMSAGNIKTKDYESISGNFKPGQTNVLE